MEVYFSPFNMSVMNGYQETNMSTLITLLNELRSKFDHQLLHGESFDEAKKVYLQIKELESQLKRRNFKTEA